METAKTSQAKIEEHLSHLFSLFGIEAKIVSEMDEKILRITATTSNDELFIGRTADPLLALQHLLRVMFKKELAAEEASLILNIGDFVAKQKETLEALSAEAVAEALVTKSPFYLRPMSSYERRIVHMTLADHPEVTSESEGEGSGRRIVVRPK